MKGPTGIVEHLRKVVLRGEDVKTDEQLLETYLKSRDEEAFCSILRRHGPMVYGPVMQQLMGLACFFRGRAEGLGFGPWEPIKESEVTFCRA